MDVEEGALKHGLPYFALGAGRTLVVLRGLQTTHANPAGFERSMELRVVRPLAAHFRVYAVGRGPGMAKGTTMADIAAQHAEALADRFGGPVDVLGISSGGSVALQMAADHPRSVRRLVVAASGYRLGPVAKQAQLDWASAVERGRRGLHVNARLASPSPVVRMLLTPVMWLMDPFTRPEVPGDFVAFVHAEDAFDLGDRLPEITAPTLVVGGDRDVAYPVEYFRRTAEGVADGRLIVYPGTGHVGTLMHKRFADDVRAFLAEGE
ncbi:alpha/beta fold hydrolase [Actinomadura kijaniata]|uniref:alpha/beta fold hydrolase n=1 Tax=Actinomadura kijaniata TaxID=46161 RepID=UPI00082A67A8|nr:alpha/beta hydrolase [Actinomadura kijaniata]